MGKKNKSKFLLKQQKKTASKEDPEAVKTETSKVADKECTEPKDQDLKVETEESNKHLEQVAAIAKIPLRLDQQIDGIKAIQQQLYKLHLQQARMLDDCTKLLQELNALQPRNGIEEKLVLDTFHDIKDKLSDVFERFLPNQLDILKHESKILGMSKNIKPT